MITFLTIVHVLVCLFLILVVLLQAGKGGGMGIAFGGGGGSQTVFGSSGAGNFLTRLTSITAFLFLLTSLALAHYSSQQDSRRLQRLAEQKAAQKKDEDARSAKLKMDLDKARQNIQKTAGAHGAGRGTTEPAPAAAATKTETKAETKTETKRRQGQGRPRRRARRPRRRRRQRLRARKKATPAPAGQAPTPPRQPTSRPPRTPKVSRLRPPRSWAARRCRCRSSRPRGPGTTSSSSICAATAAPPAAAGDPGSCGRPADLRPPLRRRRRRRAGHPAQRQPATRACACSTPTAARPRCAATACAAWRRSCTNQDPALRRPTLNIETGAGVLACTLDVASGAVRDVAEEMGRPRLTRSEIPLSPPGGERALREPIRARDRSSASPPSRWGTRTPSSSSTADDDLRALAETYGPTLEVADRFPAPHERRIRARARPGEIDLVVWERGSGLTLACGTGACATVVAACLEGRLAPGAETPVHLPGGTLAITVAPDYSGVRLRGPARIVFTGVLSDAQLQPR